MASDSRKRNRNMYSAMPNLFERARQFSLKRNGSEQIHRKEVQHISPKGILRSSSDSLTCAYCNQNNQANMYGTETLRYRIGNIPGCQMCGAMNKEQKKRVRFDSIVTERNFFRSEDEQPSGRKYRKVSTSSKLTKTKPTYQNAMFACSICNISMKTESEFITHQRLHGMKTAPLPQYGFQFPFQDNRHMSSLLFVRQ